MEQWQIREQLLYPATRASVGIHNVYMRFWPSHRHMHEEGRNPFEAADMAVNVVERQTILRPELAAIASAIRNHLE